MKRCLDGELLLSATAIGVHIDRAWETQKEETVNARNATALSIRMTSSLPRVMPTARPQYRLTRVALTSSGERAQRDCAAALRAGVPGGGRQGEDDALAAAAGAARAGARARVAARADALSSSRLLAQCPATIGATWTVEVRAAVLRVAHPDSIVDLSTGTRNAPSSTGILL